MPSERNKSHQKLIFFIVDGFSNYYLSTHKSPLNGVEEILKNGIRAEYVTPVFPSFSLPNYYSMFTGLTVEKHGMISNIMYDREWREMFKIDLPDRDRWYRRAPETAWVKASKQGIRTSLYWPWFVNLDSPVSRGENLHHYERESEFINQHGKPKFNDWIDEKLDKIALELQDDTSQFVVVYWSTLDTISHKYGPNATETMEELESADRALLKLQNKLSEKKLWDTVNLIVVSDHGQTHAPKENRIFLEDHCPNLNDIEVICENEPVKYVYPTEGKTSEVYERLKNANIPHVKVYLNEDVPESFKYKNAKCCPPILLLADPNYSICVRSINSEFLDAGHYSNGLHGYDNTFQDMRGVFFARGPNFQKGLIGPPIRTIDYYLFMRHILSLDDANKCDTNDALLPEFVT